MWRTCSLSEFYLQFYQLRHQAFIETSIGSTPPPTSSWTSTLYSFFFNGNKTTSRPYPTTLAELLARAGVMNTLLQSHNWATHLDSCQHTISYVKHTISYNSDESIRYRMFLHTISYVAISYVKTYDIVLRYGIIEPTISYHLIYDIATYDIVCLTYDVVCNIRCRMLIIRCCMLQSYATSCVVGNTSYVRVFLSHVI